MPAHYRDCASFDPRLMQPTFAGHRTADARLAEAAAAIAQHPEAGGARFARPLNVRVRQCPDGRPAGAAAARGTRR
jgi:hypothetical protein